MDTTSRIPPRPGPAPRVELRRAWRALRVLIADPERTDQVFELTQALSGRSGERLFRRFLAHPDGPALLAARPALLDALADRAALLALPPGSLGRAYAAFMDAEQLDADGLVAASQAPSRRREDAGPERQWLFERLRDMHDLWHVLTGYGRDEAGEAANLAFTWGQIRDPGIGVIVFAAAAIGPKRPRLAWQRYLMRAWQRGRRAAWLPVVRFEDELPRPLAEVRRRLGIAPPEIAHPEGIVVASRAELLGLAAAPGADARAGSVGAPVAGGIHPAQAAVVRADAPSSDAGAGRLDSPPTAF